MKRNWRRRAKAYLVKHDILNGYNGRWASPEAEAMIDDLARIFARIYNYPPTE
jgi:hypothetical protein